MNQNHCDIARDLMPLAIDGVCSEGSQRFLDEHVAACQPCQSLYTRMKNIKLPEMQADAADEAQALKTGLRWLGRRFKALWIALAALVGAFVLLLTAAGIQQTLWYWMGTAPLDTYTVEAYRQDAMFCMSIATDFTAQAYNGVSCEGTLVTTNDNHTGETQAMVLTYSVSWFPNQAKDFHGTPYNGPLQNYKLCVDDGKLYTIGQKEGMNTTYGKPLMLYTPDLPVSEIRFTDGKDTYTLYTWGDEIPNVSADRVDEYGLPQSGVISPSDLEKYSEFIAK